MEIKLTKPQSVIFTHPARHKVLVCGRRFGKTFAALVWLWEKASNTPDSLHYYIAPTYAAAKQIAWRQLKQMFGAYAEKTNEAELYIQLYNGAAIYLKGAENADALRGVSLSSVCIDEAAYIHEDVWNYVIAPACSDKQAPVLFITSPASWNWIKTLYDKGRERMDEQWAAWQFTTAEGGNVTPEEIEERRRSLPPKVFAQEYLASFEVLSNRVYSNFDADKNIIRDDIDTRNYADLHIGIDFNVAQMSAVVAVKVADEIHVIEEIALEESNTQELAEVLASKYKGKHIYCYPDPSSRSRKTSAALGETDFTILEDAGFYVIAPKKHDAVQDRINTVQSMLCNAKGERRLFVHKDCKNLTDSLQGLTYDVDKNAPDKKSGLDHMCFAGDTLVRVNGRIMRMDEIPREGYVDTIFGKRKYKNGGLTRTLSDTICLKLSTGEQIVCTKDHKFLTPQGWMEAKDLLGCHVLNKDMMEKFITCANTTSKEMELGCIGKSMKTFTGPSPKATTFTTATGISQIIHLKISNFYHTAIMRGITRINRSKSPVRDKVLRLRESMRLCGMVVRKAGHGTKSTTKNTSTCYMKRLLKFVRSAVVSLWGIRERCSVRKTVSPAREESQVSMTRLELASFVARNIGLINTQKLKPAVEVVGVSYSPKQNVYCLTTDDGHFVLANGIVVSNSDALGYMIMRIAPVNTRMSTFKMRGLM